MPIFVSKQQMTEAKAALDKMTFVSALFASAGIDLEATIANADDTALKQALDEARAEVPEGYSQNPEPSAPDFSAMTREDIPEALLEEIQTEATEEMATQFSSYQSGVMDGLKQVGAEIPDEEYTSTSLCAAIVTAVGAKISTKAEARASERLASIGQDSEDLPDAEVENSKPLTDDQWKTKIHAASGAERTQLIRDYKQSKRRRRN